jgi:hypothetical protein
VRNASFELADDHKVEKGVGIHLPRAIREARKPLYPVMESDKKDRKQVRFVGKNIYINNVLHISESSA